MTNAEKYNLDILNAGHQGDVERGDNFLVVALRQHRNLVTAVKLYEGLFRQNPDSKRHKEGLAQARTDLENFEKKLKKQLASQRKNLRAKIQSLVKSVNQNPDNDEYQETLEQARTDLKKLEEVMKKLK